MMSGTAGYAEVFNERFLLSLLLALVLHVLCLVMLGIRQPEPATQFEITLLPSLSNTKAQPDSSAIAHTASDQQSSPVDSSNSSASVAEYVEDSQDKAPNLLDSPAFQQESTQDKCHPDRIRFRSGELVAQDCTAQQTEQAMDSPAATVSDAPPLSLSRILTLTRPNSEKVRIRRLSAGEAESIIESYYLASWQRKIRSIGRLNYPPEARTLKLESGLQLLISVRHDGELLDVRVLASSGHSVLDEAAMRIVRLAAPFNPFPDKIRRQADVLEVVHDWRFR